jgi:hypothetical protein
MLKRNINFVCRLSLNWKYRIIKVQGAGDYIIEIKRCEDIPECQRTEGGPKTQVVRTRLRLLEYKTGKNECVRLVTSLLDPVAYPAREVALSYHVRWEAELTYDEIKTHFFTVLHGKLHTNFRSKAPDGVEQEVYAMLVTYNFVRNTIVAAAKLHDLKPLEISFVESLQVITCALRTLETAALEQLPRLHLQLLKDIAACRLKRPRRKRSNPRKVKIKMSKFPRKRRGDRGELRDFESELQLLERAA